MTKRPLTLSDDEENAVFVLLLNSTLNAAARSPVTDLLIKLLWKIEARRVVGDLEGHA